MSDTWKNVAAQWLTSGLEESLPTKTLPREISTKFIISFYFNPLLAGWSYLCFFPKSTTSYLLVWKKATSQRLNWSFLQLLIRGYYAKCSMATPFALIYHCCPAIIQVAFIEKYFIRQIISGSFSQKLESQKKKKNAFQTTGFFCSWAYKVYKAYKLSLVSVHNGYHASLVCALPRVKSLSLILLKMHPIWYTLPLIYSRSGEAILLGDMDLRSSSHFYQSDEKT